MAIKFPRKIRFGLIIAAIAMMASAPSTAQTQIPYPRLKPAAPNISYLLSEADAKNFKAAMASVDRRYWRDVVKSREKISNPIATDTLRWLQSWRDTRVTLNDLTYVVHNLSDWPKMVTIKAKAERQLWDKEPSAQDTISWFRGTDPVSGEGRVALARAYFKLGRIEEGKQWLKLGWREARLTRDLQRSIYKSYKKHFTPQDHAARADYLIWLGRSHFNKVEGLLSLMPKGERALAVARMRVARNASGMDAAIRAVPTSLKTHPGLLYERAKWRRRKKTKEYALPVYLQSLDAPATIEGKKNFWIERKIMAYWAIKEGRFSDAYKLTLNHGLTSGSGFADAEFLAGWLALVKLNQPAKAIQHFEALRVGVSYPVSKSRASYWLARAHKAASLPDYLIHFAQAAEHVHTFYGQLAASELGQDPYIFLPPETNGFTYQAEFEQDRRVQALRLFGETRREYYFNQMAYHLDDEVDNVSKLTLLSQLSREYGYMKPSVRAAKQASRFGTFLTNSGYPKPEIFTALPSKFNKAFSMALSRQESEFNPEAVSPAKAYGLMQMINGTAKATARKHRLPYSKSRLTADPEYSAKLGSLHVNDLLERFDGSYIMTAAAYNAGPHRVTQWVRDYGDPRTGEVDPIDWIESIPFSETRNYIQRVLENLNVYRARLNDNQARNLLLQDITVGAL